MTSDAILALHLGVVTGWTHGPIDQRPRYGSWRIADSARCPAGEIGAAFLDALGDHCKVYGRPAVIAVSAPLLIADDEDSAKSAIIAIGLTMAAQIYAYRKSVTVIIPEFEPMKRTMLAGHAGLGAWCRAGDYEPGHASASYALLLHAYCKRLRSGT